VAAWLAPALLAAQVIGETKVANLRSFEFRVFFGH
jgi:hypothetical protein